jgi:hypothetical protein|tara:strand:+ start:536 stop:811 length:276 start_codon:yes stop_codon:yes gene_type:complete
VVSVHALSIERIYRLESSIDSRLWLVGSLGMLIATLMRIDQLDNQSMIQFTWRIFATQIFDDAGILLYDNFTPCFRTKTPLGEFESENAAM